MNQSQFLITKTSFAKAIMLGHSINIVVALFVFLLSHYIAGHPTVVSIILTLVGTIIGAIISSIVGTKQLTAPVHTLSQELQKLNQKITESTSALTQLSNESRAFSEALPIGIITLNAKGELTHANGKALQQLTIIPQENNTSEESSDQQQPFTAETILARIVSVGSTHGNDVAITDWLHQAKTAKIQDSKLWPMIASQDEQGNTIAFDIFVRYNKGDSHGYEVVILLIDRTQEYLRQDKQMEFISLAAHELRGPVAVLRGLVDVFQEELTNLTEDHQELLRRMRVSTRQLAGYIDNILNVSHIEKEDFSVRPAEIQWADVLAQTLGELNIRATAHGRRIELSVPKNLPTAAVDVGAMLHVINNLVDNAIKYSKEGGIIKIKATQKGDTIETTVQDFGIGIPANVVDGLFTKFYRSHKSRSAINGTGLGLYLCKAIVSAHGGSIWVRSSENKGTTFGFEIPTYASVAEKLKNNDNDMSGIVRSSHGWIKNHALYRR